MKILCVDIGTGTQDILLYDSRLDLENGFKLVVPSPTMRVHRRLKEATRQRKGVVLTGVTMGAALASGRQKTTSGQAYRSTPRPRQPARLMMT